MGPSAGCTCCLAIRLNKALTHVLVSLLSSKWILLKDSSLPESLPGTALCQWCCSCLELRTAFIFLPVAINYFFSLSSKMVTPHVMVCSSNYATEWGFPTQCFEVPVVGSSHLRSIQESWDLCWLINHEVCGGFETLIFKCTFTHQPKTVPR